MCQSVEVDTQCDVACTMGLERLYDPDCEKLLRDNQSLGKVGTLGSPM